MCHFFVSLTSVTAMLLPGRLVTSFKGVPESGRASAFDKHAGVTMVSYVARTLHDSRRACWGHRTYTQGVRVHQRQQITHAPGVRPSKNRLPKNSLAAAIAGAMAQLKRISLSARRVGAASGGRLCAVGKIAEAVLSVSGMNVRCTCKQGWSAVRWLRRRRRLCALLQHWARQCLSEACGALKRICALRCGFAQAHNIRSAQLSAGSVWCQQPAGRPAGRHCWAANSSPHTHT